MDSQLTNLKKSSRKSVRVITPDQIKKLGLDVLLQNLITSQTGNQNGDGNLDKSANNTVTEAKLKISIHKSNDVNGTASQQVVERNESINSVDASQSASIRISSKNDINIIKNTNRTSLKGNNEGVSDDNCKGDESSTRRLRSIKKPDDLVKPQDDDAKANKNINLPDIVNLKETSQRDLLVHEVISTRPTVSNNFVEIDSIGNTNPLIAVDKEKSEFFKEGDINFKENEDIAIDVSKREENKSKIKLPSVARRKRISSVAVIKIKSNRSNNRNKEVNELENVTKEVLLEEGDVSRVEGIETPSKTNLNEAHADETSKIVESEEGTNEKTRSINLPSVSRKKRISTETLNKINLRRYNSKKANGDELIEKEKPVEIADSKQQEDIELASNLASSNTVFDKPTKNPTDENRTTELESVEENIGKHQSKEMNDSPCINQQIVVDMPSECESLNGNTVSETTTKIAATQKVAEENKIIPKEKNVAKNNIREMENDRISCKEQQDQSLIEKPSNSASLNSIVATPTEIHVVENNVTEKVINTNLARVSRKKKISSETLSNLNSRRNNKKKNKISELENDDEIKKSMEMDESPSIMQHDQPLIQMPTKAVSLNNDVVENETNGNVNLTSVCSEMVISSETTVEIETVEKEISVDAGSMELNDQLLNEGSGESVSLSNEVIDKSAEIEENSSNMNSPSVVRKTRISKVALNKINLRRSNSKKEEKHELENVGENVETKRPIENDVILHVDQQDESLIETPSKSKSLNIDKPIEIAEVEKIINENVDSENMTVKNNSIEDNLKSNIDNADEVESSNGDNRLVIDENTSTGNSKLSESQIAEANVGLSDSINLNISTEIIEQSKNQVETNVDLNDSSNRNNSNDLKTPRRSRISRAVNISNVARRTSKRNSICKSKDAATEPEIQDAVTCQINEGPELPEIKQKSENKEANVLLQLEDNGVLNEDVNNKGTEQSKDLLTEEKSVQKSKKITTRKNTSSSLNLENNDKLQTEEIIVKRSKRISLKRKDDEKPTNDIDCNLQQASNSKESKQLNSELVKLELKGGTRKKVSDITKDTKNVKVCNKNNKLKELPVKSVTKESEVNVSVNEINKSDEKKVSRSPKVAVSKKDAIGKSSKANESKTMQKKITDFLIFKEKPKPDDETNVGKSRKRKASNEVIECETVDHEAKNTLVNDAAGSKSQIGNRRGLSTRSKKVAADVEVKQIKNEDNCRRKSSRTKSDIGILNSFDLKNSESDLLKENESHKEAEPVTDTANVSDEDVITLKPQRNKRKRSIESDEPSKKLKENTESDEGESSKMYNTSSQQKKLILVYSHELKQKYAELLKKPGRIFGKISGTVVCAMCNESFENSLWATHKLTHNNIAWRVGEAPMSLEPSVITSILNKLYKCKKKMYCHVCSDSKKSVYGFLCHFIVCGKSEYEVEEMKIPCKVCSTRILPCLYLFHLKNHNKAEKVEYADKKTDDISLESPRRARVAAKKASAMIESVSKYLDRSDDGYFVKNIFKKSDFDIALNKEISSKGFVRCPFESCDAKLENVEKIIKHFEECPHKPEEVYMCKKCLYCNKVRADMINHVQQHQKKNKSKNDDNEFKANVSSSDSDDDDNDHEDSKLTTVTAAAKSTNTQSGSKLYKFQFLRETPKKIYLHGVLCNRNYKWMLDFCNENYTDKKLFMKFAFSSKYVDAVGQEDANEYLPRKKRSAANMQQNINDYDKSRMSQDCKKYIFCETESNETSTNIYCGGPVSAIAWAPTPYDADNCNQVLAVAVNYDHDKRYTSEVNTDTGLLEFWSFGNMDSATLSGALKPEMAFCIGHNYGYIKFMEWCPSGCYDDDRLGLLCVCSTDSFVYGLSVGQPSRVTDKLLSAKPAFKLCLSRWRDMDLGDCDFNPTSISWSKYAGHKYIAVGYSNGVVALYDLSAVSVLTMKEEDDLTIFYPYRSFSAHSDIVTSVQLYHMHGGKRWLATGSNDRAVKFWDLERPILPIYVNQRASVSQLLWLINHLGTIDAHNDFLNTQLQATTVSHVREFVSSVNNVVMYSSTSVNSISCNEWSSILVQGNDMGEVVGCHFDNFFSTAPPKRFYISSIELKGKHAEVNTDSTVYPTYKDVCDNFNVVYHDYDMKFYKNVIKKSEPLVSNRGQCHPSPTPNIFPLQAVTQVAINPNRHSYYYIAAGYKLGFVKIFKMKMFKFN